MSDALMKEMESITLLSPGKEPGKRPEKDRSFLLVDEQENLQVS